MNKNLIKRNIISSLIMQAVNVICGFILPKAMLSAFGSEVNGLVSSISQFLSYVTLLEGGVSGVIAAALYKPLAQKDNQKLNAVVNAARKFFFHLGLICMLYTIVIAIIYPILKHTPYSPGYIFALTIVLSCSLMTQYFFGLSYSILIKSDRRVYVLYYVQTVSIILNTILVLLAIRWFHDILIVKLITAGVYVLNPIFYSYYAHKYFDLDRKVRPDEQAISQRWDGFGQTLAYFIHSNTDVIILTVFSSLSTVSVYSIYLLIANAMKNIISAISNAVVPSIGNLIGQGNTEVIREAYYKYEYGISLIALTVFSCGMVLIVPFVSVYTKGVNDANYIQPLFGYLIVLSELVYCFREPSTGLIYSAGHFKQTAKFAYAEAGLNIVLSLCLVQKYDLVGVAVGTLLAMLLRWILHTLYLKKNIIYASGHDTMKIAGSSIIDIIIVILICKLLVPNVMDSYFEWAKYGLFVLIINLFVISSVNILISRTKFVDFIQMCFRKRMK